jgi:hypothetical protein
VVFLVIWELFALANVYGANVLAVGNELAVGRHKSDPGVRHFTSEAFLLECALLRITASPRQDVPTTLPTVPENASRVPFFILPIKNRF